ncbi:hypothetical protein JAAARDRAFT_693658 [Jaapia argillacea MUCL 33604]|uniref:Uncharacterized protein n=1 Tax=Jaapia argillacea MUCL 33604 TaxID=933084 RepID=A0A067PUQ2_9AGAM|nr:hypothetical protein JAAARDRAFT_693658 [Jaapia argillacea MUCL 33604]
MHSGKNAQDHMMKAAQASALLKAIVEVELNVKQITIILAEEEAEDFTADLNRVSDEHEAVDDGLGLITVVASTKGAHSSWKTAPPPAVTVPTQSSIILSCSAMDVSNIIQVKFEVPDRKAVQDVVMSSSISWLDSKHLDLEEVFEGVKEEIFLWVTEKKSKKNGKGIVPVFSVQLVDLSALVKGGGMKDKYFGPYQIGQWTQGGSYVLRELSRALLRKGVAAFRLLLYTQHIPRGLDAASSDLGSSNGEASESESEGSVTSLSE